MENFEHRSEMKNIFVIDKATQHNLYNPLLLNVLRYPRYNQNRMFLSTSE